MRTLEKLSTPPLYTPKKKFFAEGNIMYQCCGCFEAIYYAFMRKRTKMRAAIKQQFLFVYAKHLGIATSLNGLLPLKQSSTHTHTHQKIKGRHITTLKKLTRKWACLQDVGVLLYRRTNLYTNLTTVIFHFIEKVDFIY